MNDYQKSIIDWPGRKQPVQGISYEWLIQILLSVCIQLFLSFLWKNCSISLRQQLFTFELNNKKSLSGVCSPFTQHAILLCWMGSMTFRTTTLGLTQNCDTQLIIYVLPFYFLPLVLLFTICIAILCNCYANCR